MVCSLCVASVRSEDWDGKTHVQYAQNHFGQSRIPYQCTYARVLQHQHGGMRKGVVCTSEGFRFREPLFTCKRPLEIGRDGHGALNLVSHRKDSYQGKRGPHSTHLGL